MMIADLVDEEDFNNLLRTIGISVDVNATMKESLEHIERWKEGKSHLEMLKLDDLIAELALKKELLHPDVRSGIEKLLAGAA